MIFLIKCLKAIKIIKIKITIIEKKTRRKDKTHMKIQMINYNLMTKCTMNNKISMSKINITIANNTKKQNKIRKPM